MNVIQHLRTHLTARDTHDWWALGISSLIIGILLYGVTLVTPYTSSIDTPFYQVEELSSESQELRATVHHYEKDTLFIKLHDGPQAGSVVAAYQGEDKVQRLSEGSSILVSESQHGSSEALYVLDRWRLPSLAILCGIFVFVAVFVGGKRGAMSLLGLIIGIAVIGWGALPLIIQGWPAFWVCLIAAFIVAVFSILVAHGLRIRTYLSIAIITVLLIGVGILSVLVIGGMGLTGISDESAYYIAIGMTQIDRQGVAAGGIVIATLGLLDDIVTTQVATVEELYNASNKRSFQSVVKGAQSVGREHIASLVNTLALAYIGASLPVIIHYTTISISSPLLIINSEYIATEVVRTIVASLGLVLAVPVSTYLAAMVFRRLV